MKTTTIAKKVSIKAPINEVWKVLSDIGNVVNTSPNISKSYVTSEIKEGVGATRHCDFVMMGAQVEERVTEWNEGRSLKIDIYERKNIPMIADMKAEFDLEEAGNEETILSGAMKYQMSNVVAGMLNAIMFRRMNEKTWKEFLAGIKHHIETGEPVSQSTKLDTSIVF